ncbi:ArsC/Spx/MgsR family protein [Pseudooceanicola aestuarii]|uniref:ArsC/Spx/MgsR family protein n=1 Tax=Pseudooceanicola aestuarii TaxID=2697319 RepID=UPI001EF916D4|nr:ArsC/Spx/MgsR family protein [Pseudooceanicola aestuarii]
MTTGSVPILVYGLKTCDTTRACVKAIENAELVDVQAQGVPAALLARAEKRFGAALLNARSTTWRGLDAEERARPPLDLLAEYPKLMKRPLIIRGDDLYLGWTDDTRTALTASADI